MGCGGSKSTSAAEGATVQTTQAASDSSSDSSQDSSQRATPAQAPESSSNSSVKDDLLMVDASSYMMAEQKLTEERAQRLVETIQTDTGGKVLKRQLVALNDKINEIKCELLPQFAAHDPDGTGFVDPEAAVTILGSAFPGIPDTSLRAMMARYDRDNNNKIDVGEFLVFYSFVKSKKADLEQQFDALDGDGSGNLDAEELVQTLIRECAIEEFMARSLVEDFDLDKNGTINKEEFMKMWLSLFG